MAYKTIEQRVARARFCLEKALREKRELDARQQRRRLGRLLKEQERPGGADALV
jgi:hypothetical protein